MADEIRIAITLDVNNPPFKFVYSVNDQFDQSGIGGGNPGKVSIGTIEEVVSFGDLSTPSWLFMQNIDDTNSVIWGGEDGVSTMAPIGVLAPKEFAIFRLTLLPVLRMQATPSTATVYIAAFEV